MRAILILAVAVIGGVPVATEAMVPPGFFATSDAADYKAGWKAGWVDGWKHVKGKHSYPPYPPYPPYPEFGRSSYQDGYQDGFVAGREAAD